MLLLKLWSTRSQPVYQNQSRGQSRISTVSLQSQSHSLFAHILLTLKSIDIGGQLRRPQLRSAYNKNHGQPKYINRRTATRAIGEFHRLLSEFLPAFLNPRTRRVFALIFSEHLRQIPDPVKIAILVRFIFAFLYTRIHIICARTWYCFNPCQLAKIWIVTGRTEMLFLRQNFIHKISYTPISKNPAKIRMLSSHRKSQNTAIPAADTARKHVPTVSRSDNPPQL